MDAAGNVKNVKFYRPKTDGARSKKWGVKGYNEARLFPLSSLDAGEIFVCAGELDGILLNQEGLPAITGTGGEGYWNVRRGARNSLAKRFASSMTVTRRVGQGR